MKLVGGLCSMLIVSYLTGALSPFNTKDYTLGLKTNFSLCPCYPFHKSLYHRYLFLKPQLKFYPQFRNANPEKQNTFWGLFIFRGNSTRAPASSRVTYFILLAYTGTGVSHGQRRKKIGRGFGKKCRRMDRKCRNNLLVS